MPEIIRAETEAKEDVDEQAVSLTPGVVAYDPLVEPPYGWVVCISMHVINAFTWGIIASYGVYLSYYIDHDVFPNTSDFDYTFVGGVNFACAMLSGPIVNICVRKVGIHFPMYCGATMYVAGFVAASFATQFWHLVLSQGILVGLGTGFAWLPATPIISQWFNRNRSLAQGIAAAGSGIGGIIASAATTPMIQNISLAWSLRITGILSFVMLTIAASLMRDRNKTIKPKFKAFDISLLKKYRIWLLIGYTFFSILGYIVTIYSLGAFATSIGLTQDQGGNVITFVQVGTAVGRPFVGVLSDRFGRMTVACILTASNTLLTYAIWIPATSYGVLIFYALVAGATSGIYWGTIVPVTAEVVDLTDLPSALNLMWISVSIPSLFSEAIALEIRLPHSSRPYLWPQIYTGLTFLVGSLFMLELRRQKWGLKQRERHR